MATVKRFPGAEAMAAAAARFIQERAEASINLRDRFLFVLSGGKTPLPLFERLASPDFIGSIPWDKTHVFWGDERCVPFEDEESNAASAQRILLDKAPIPKENIHRPPVENVSAELAAELWEADLRRFFTSSETFPIFDLILLGAGTDGHTASLFPGHPALLEKIRWTASVNNPKANPPTPRATLTPPVLENAKCVLFLLGKDKNFLLKIIEEDPIKAARLYPAARIQPKGELFYFISA